MTATVYEIPTNPSVAQREQVTLSGVTYTLTMRWCEPSNCWIMDIGDADGNQLIGAIPLQTGSNLLEQFDYEGFAGAMIVQSDNDADEVPSFDSLGNTGHLYYVTP